MKKQWVTGLAVMGMTLATTTVTAFASTGYGPSTTGQTISPTPGFTSVLTSQTVDTNGGSLVASAGSAHVDVQVPQGAFSSPEQISVSGGDVSTLSGEAPPNDAVVSAFGVNFSGQTPNEPITVTISNASIPANGQVFKVTGTNWVPVQATVTGGKAVISFTSDPNFVVVAPKTASTTAPKSTTSTSSTSTTSGSQKPAGTVTGATKPVTGVAFVNNLFTGIGLLAVGGAMVALSFRKRRSSAQ